MRFPNDSSIRVFSRCLLSPSPRCARLYALLEHSSANTHIYRAVVECALLNTSKPVRVHIRSNRQFDSTDIGGARIALEINSPTVRWRIQRRTASEYPSSGE
jgi:hypothetical protein